MSSKLNIDEQIANMDEQIANYEHRLKELDITMQKIMKERVLTMKMQKIEKIIQAIPTDYLKAMMEEMLSLATAGLLPLCIDAYKHDYIESSYVDFHFNMIYREIDKLWLYVKLYIDKSKIISCMDLFNFVYGWDNDEAYLFRAFMKYRKAEFRYGCKYDTRLFRILNLNEFEETDDTFDFGDISEEIDDTFEDVSKEDKESSIRL